MTGISGMVGSSAEHQTGQGSWNSNGATVDFRISPESVGLGPKTVGDIASVEYYSNNALIGTGGSEGVDFGLYIYTKGTMNGWYGERLTAEPLYARNHLDPANTWNRWTTDSAAENNTLTWYANGYKLLQGWAGTMPTLDQLKAADFSWNQYYPAADATPVNYSAMEIFFFKFGTGSAWSSAFHGYLDAITFNFTDGDQLTIDLENQPSALFVDDSWTSVAAGADPDGAGPATAFGADAFNAIQPAINAAAPNATISIYPGNYPTGVSITNVDPSTGGPGGNNFILFANKPGLTLRGVDASGSPITSASNVAAKITATAEAPTFGTSVLFIQADNVTVQGLELAPLIPNKNIEVWGNGFTLRNSLVHGGEGGSTVYFNEEKVGGYTVDSNILDGGIAIASGAGTTGLRETRQITNNQISSSFYGIGFRGKNANVAWYAKPVGGAVIEGNTFSGAPMGHVYADGEYTEADLHWQEIFERNTFDKTVVLRNAAGEFANNSWLYNTKVRPNVRRIGSTIQYDLDRAATGDTLTVSAGLFPEELTFRPSASNVTLTGAGADKTIIEAPDTTIGFTVTLDGPGSLISGVTIRNDAAKTNSMGIAWGYQASGSTLEKSKVEGFLTGIYLGSSADGVVIMNNAITGNANGILIEGALNNTIISNNDISANTRVDDYFTDRPNASIRVLDAFTGQNNTIERNALVGSSHGLDNNSETAIAAEHNWWGSKNGPAAASKVEGPADVDPWLCAGVDGDTNLIGFQPASTDYCTADTAARLVFTTQPADVMANQPFAASLALRVEDADGHLVVTFNGPVTLTLGGGVQNAALKGAKTVNAVNGIVTFPSLSVDRWGTDFTLTASATGLTSATSAAFDVSALKIYVPLTLRR